MPRLARVVVPDVPHHITQRGVRGLPTFLGDDDYRRYLQLLRSALPRAKAGILAYCLMPNHVHLIVVPGHEDSLRLLLAETHRRYAREINERENWSGHLWQERYYSCPMSEQHTIAAIRYVEMNPVRAGIVSSPFDYKWSSATSHLSGEADGLIQPSEYSNIVGNWRAFLLSASDNEFVAQLKKHERTGRPLGSPEFIHTMELRAGRPLKKHKPGPKSSR